MFTLIHNPDGHEHVTCDRCKQTKTFPKGDTRGIHAWTASHSCRPPRTQPNRGSTRFNLEPQEPAA